MIRAVCDVNVLVSGFLYPERPIGRVLRFWLAGGFTLIVSEPLVAATANTFAKPYFATRLTAPQITANLSLLEAFADCMPLTHPVSGVAPDAEDDVVLSTALAGGADYLVTGDRRFRQLGRYERVTLVTATECLRILESQPNSPTNPM